MHFWGVLFFVFCFFQNKSSLRYLSCAVNLSATTTFKGRQMKEAPTSSNRFLEPLWTASETSLIETLIKALADKSQRPRTSASGWILGLCEGITSSSNHWRGRKTPTYQPLLPFNPPSLLLCSPQPQKLLNKPARSGDRPVAPKRLIINVCPQHPEALALCSCKDARHTHKEQSQAHSKHPCALLTEWIRLDIPNGPLTLVERGCINAGHSLCVSKPYSLSGADTDIDSWSTTPLPESIKSLHGIDWAGRKSGCGDRGRRWWATGR